MAAAKGIVPRIGKKLLTRVQGAVVRPQTALKIASRVAPVAAPGFTRSIRNGNAKRIGNYTGYSYNLATQTYKKKSEEILDELRNNVSAALYYKTKNYRKQALGLVAHTMDTSGPLYNELIQNEADHTREPNELNQILKNLVPFLDPYIVELIRVVGNTPTLNFAFVPKKANIKKTSALNEKKQLETLTTLGKPTTLENVLDYLYNDPNSGEYGKKVFVLDPDTGTFKKCETSKQAFDGLVKTRIMFDDNMSINMKHAASNLNINLDDPQTEIIDHIQKFFQHQGRLTELGERQYINYQPFLDKVPGSLKVQYKNGKIVYDSNGYPVRGKLLGGGGLLDALLLDDETRNQYIESIDTLVEIYFSDTNFTYDSFFNGTYKGENPEPTNDQKLKDGEFTIFLMNVSNKLSDPSATILPDLMLLHNKLKKTRIHPYFLQYGKKTGGTRKYRAFKNKGKRYSRRR